MKPSVLYGNVPVSILKRPLSAADKLRIKERSSEHKVTEIDAWGRVAGSEGLKATQEYPLEYGEAAATALTSPPVVAIDDADTEDESDRSGLVNDNWADTGFPRLGAWIGLPCDRFVV